MCNAIGRYGNEEGGWGQGHGGSTDIEERGVVENLGKREKEEEKQNK
jgi:hypothetical protein